MAFTEPPHPIIENRAGRTFDKYALTISETLKLCTFEQSQTNDTVNTVKY